jgi:hypothetical protein
MGTYPWTPIRFRDAAENLCDAAERFVKNPPPDIVVFSVRTTETDLYDAAIQFVVSDPSWRDPEERPRMLADILEGGISGDAE